LASTPPKPIQAGWKIEYSQVDVFRNNLRLVWVFADFVKKTMMGGGSMIPLLRLAPIQVETGVLEHYMFALEYHVPVIRARIQQFGITIVVLRILVHFFPLYIFKFIKMNNK